MSADAAGSMSADVSNIGAFGLLLKPHDSTSNPRLSINVDTFISEQLADPTMQHLLQPSASGFGGPASNLNGLNSPPFQKQPPRDSALFTPEDKSKFCTLVAKKFPDCHSMAPLRTYVKQFVANSRLFERTSMVSE